MISALVVNHETTITITLRDSDSNPLPDTKGELCVRVEEMTKDTALITVKQIKDIGNGKYETFFTTNNYGDHMISILVGGKHIPGSPYKYVCKYVHTYGVHVVM